MKTVTLCLLAMVQAALLLGAPWPAEARMPEGSFATAPIATPQELGNLLLSDPITARRYSTHFGKDPGELAAYIHNNLRPSTLQKPAVYRVYYITPAGRVVTRQKRLEAGTPVFVDHRGQPLIEGRCGNPMVRTFPPPEPKIGVHPVTSELDFSLGGPGLVEVAALPQGSYDVGMISPLQPPLEEVKGFATILAAASIPALLGATSVHGSKVIPEPSSLMVLAAGGVTAIIRMRRSRRA